MAKVRWRHQILRFAAVLLGVALLVFLMRGTGPSRVVDQLKTVGRGLALVIALGGIAHLIKTLAWRLTFLCDIRAVSFARTFGLRLVSEGIGSFGLPGQVLGETTRVHLLGSTLPVANSISSVTLDRGLYIMTSALVSVTGILAALFLLPLSGTWRLYAFLFASVLAALLVVTAMAFRRRWPVFSGAAQAIGSLPRFKKWLDGKQSVIDSAERNLFSFYHERPKSFWASLILNLACHGMAILEVYLLLHFIGARTGLLGAFVLEAFTKLINVVGALNPGNFGTYEAGNMLLTRLLGITNAAGLTLGLCRRARSLFWKGTGFLCLIAMLRSTRLTRRSLPVRYNAVEVSRWFRQMLRYSHFLGLLLLLSPVIGFGRQAPLVDAPAFITVPELNSGFDLLYEQKFAEAREAFANWQSRNPEDPFGTVAIAASYLFEELNLQGVLTSDFFLNEKKFLHGIDGMPDPDRMSHFREALAEGRQLAQERQKTNPNDGEALFALTLAAGMESDAESILQKRHIAGLKRMKEANGYATQLLSQYPDAIDAYIAPGIANYVIGSQGLASRFALRFGGIHGNKKLGMEQVARTAENGRYLRPFAKIILALAARREKQDALAERLLRELTMQYPGNALFASEYAKAMDHVLR